MSFSNKVVIVTGASSGIGAATAIAFAKESANVAIIGKNETKLNQVANECTKVGKEPLIIKADVSNEKDAERIIKSTLDKFDKIDVLVNNAGIGRFGAILGGKIMQTYDEVMNINLRAVVHLTTLATPYLTESKGNIVNVSSVTGMNTPRSPLITYCVSKAALNHFTKGAALELAAAGIRVNAVSPGPVRTDILENAGVPSTWEQYKERTALSRFSEPEEMAELILYLASEKAKGITGSNFVTDNGMLLKS